MKTFNRQLESQMREHKLSIWWNKNRYIIMRIILFPIWLGILANEKIRNRQYENLTYSEKRTKQILDRYLPKLFARHLKNFDPDDPIRVLVSNSSDPYGIDISSFYRGLFIPRRKRHDYFYYQKFNRQILEYLWTKYEIDGWKAIRLNSWAAWSKVEEEYDWVWKCWDKDHSKGVYFIKEDV